MKFFKKLMAAAAITAVAATVSVAQARVYKFATNIPEVGYTGQLLNDFAAKVAERTDGRVKFKIFWNSSLGGADQYLQQIKSGVIDMGIINSAVLENVAPEMGVLNLPYVFLSTDYYSQCLKDPFISKTLKDSIARNGFMLTGYINNATRGIYANKELKSFEDLAGMKIRTNASDTYIKMFKYFGAVATPTDFSEVFSALQQGLIDGAEGGVQALYDLNFAEAAKFGLLTDHSRLTDFIVNSEKFAKRLGDDYQVVLDEMQKMGDYSMEFIDKVSADSMKLAVSEKGCVIHEVDKTKFIDAVQPIYEETLQDPAKKPLLEAIFKIQGREI